MNDLGKGETVGKIGLKQIGVIPILPAWSKVILPPLDEG